MHRIEYTQLIKQKNEEKKGRIEKRLNDFKRILRVCVCVCVYINFTSA